MIIFTKRVIILCGKRTSIRLCETEWQTLENICRRENMRRNALLNLIAEHKAKGLGLTPAIRLFMLNYLHSLSPHFLSLPINSETTLSCLLNGIK
jgi:predicted DNA-binding ribbon-helix-helix protein